MVLIYFFGVAKLKEYTISNVTSSFSVKPDESISMLLGAGASISSGIMSGGQMVWDFIDNTRLPKRICTDKGNRLKNTF